LKKIEGGFAICNAAKSSEMHKHNQETLKADTATQAAKKKKSKERETGEVQYWLQQVGKGWGEKIASDYHIKERQGAYAGQPERQKKGA